MTVKIMYAEAGSLRKLRGEIRRAPDFDPALEMISGQSLFLFDQRGRTGPGTAQFYKKSAARLLRGFRRDALPETFSSGRLGHELEEIIDPSAETFEGDSVVEGCVRRGDLMVRSLMRELPAGGVQ